METRRNFTDAAAARTQHFDRATLQTGRSAPRVLTESGKSLPRSESHAGSTLADKGVSYSLNEDPKQQRDTEKTFRTLTDRQRQKEEREFRELQQSMLQPFTVHRCVQGWAERCT